MCELLNWETIPKPLKRMNQSIAYLLERTECLVELDLVVVVAICLRTAGIRHIDSDGPAPLDQSKLVEVLEDFRPQLLDHSYDLLLDAFPHLFEGEHVLRVEQTQHPCLHQLLVLQQVVHGQNAYVRVQREEEKESHSPQHSLPSVDV